MKLCDLRPGLGARKKRKRVGRGISAGQGRTCGRGQKGQKSRGTVARGFEGGQTPLHRRLPKLRGTSNQARNIGVFRHRYAVVNVGDLACFEAGTEITPEALKAAGVVKKLEDGLKVLGQGELRVNLVVKAHAFSASAEEKIKAAGGTVEVIV
jgi:large subunit ribosomal protein L15